MSTLKKSEKDNYTTHKQAVNHSSNSNEFDFQGHTGIDSIIVFFKSPSVITG